jgi:hypothetical protein
MDAMPIRTDRNSALVPFFWSGPISKVSDTVDKEKESGTSQSPIVQSDTMDKNPVPVLFDDRLGKEVGRKLVQSRPELTIERYGGQAERDTEVVDAVVLQENGALTQLFKDRGAMDKVAPDVRGYAINKYKLVQRTHVQPGSIVEIYA